ncbi:hypothetical protein [Saccharothrix algeriensis]|uniref:Tetratricopeptide (TPR) repeat protein n=1 Tax=Saccharothrix algeriensis TaxID=173560 RepID=A0ABS2SC45_9PSEU|nr:hypothetical protein [Saccharothrix algeriensis]MBM7813816.1 tetratricopeptide (TPR) repeat protein [Saccharothrix algeriensis]
MNEDKSAAEEQFVEAYHLPEGMARHEALERAARAADAADHLPLGVSCRIALLRSAYDLSRYDLMLAPFAWCGAAEKRDPTAFDEWESHSYDWAHKWIVSGLIADPRFSLAQVESVLGQLETRYRQHGFSLQPVHGARAHLAEHVGDEETYREHFARYLAAERGPMSDCEACVVEEQAGHLIRQGRHAEAVAHAEHQLDADSGCATQPQGILTALAPAYVELGDLDRARQAHTVAHRLVRDDRYGGYLDDHLVFCARTGNVQRGVELLRRQLHRVHHSPSPSQAMHFAAGGALLLSRVDRELEFAVPRDGRVEVLSTTALRELLRARALDLAARFDQRNGTAAVSGRIRAKLALPDTAHVPLAVPVAGPPAPGQAEEPVAVGDPVDLAREMAAAFDEGDFVTGIRLLRSLPADLDPLLPEGLAAVVAARRALVGRQARPLPEVLAELDAAVVRLAAAGEEDLANRYRCRGAVMWSEEAGPVAATAVARDCVAEADRSGSPYTRVLTRLLLADLLADVGEFDEQGELVRSALALAEGAAPVLVGRARCDLAQHLATTGRLDEASELVAEVLAASPSPSVRFDALRLLVKVETAQGSPAAVETAAEFVARFSSPRGPWTAEAHRQRVASVERLRVEEHHLEELRAAVSAGHEFEAPEDVAKACHALAGGYLKSGRLVEAAEALEEAVRAIEGHDVSHEIVVPVLFRLAQACSRLDENESARRHLEVALPLVPADEPWRRALVLDVLGGVLRRLDEPAGSADAYASAARAWQEVPDEPEAAGSWVESAAAMPPEEHAACLAALESAEALLPAVEDEEHRTHLVARMAAIRAFQHFQRGEHAQAVEHNGVAEELAARLGDADWQAFLAQRGARFLLASGDAVNAEAEARRVAGMVTGTTPPQIIGDTANTLEEALRAQGKPAAGDPVLRALTARLED